LVLTINKHNYSYWERSTFFENIDVAIIGSGLVGLCTAILVKKQHPKWKVTVFERGTLPSGASTKNAGFACFGSAGELLKDLETYTESEVFGLVENRWKGLQALRNLVGDKALGYENTGGYEILKTTEEAQQTTDQLTYLNTMLQPIVGQQVYTTQNNQIASFGLAQVHGLVYNSYEGLIDTGKMMAALIQQCVSLGVFILNGINVLKVNNLTNGAQLVLENDFTLTTAKVAICTNAFAKQLLPQLQLTPGRGQVLVTKPLANIKINAGFHFDKGYFYFRHLPNNRLLLGGGRNINFEKEATDSFSVTLEVQNELHNYLHTLVLPNQNFEIDYTWSGIMAFGPDQKPIVKAIDSHIYCAVKCQGMGLALGAQTAANLVKIMC
jgi:gamma-glutamylputrescine oxidase